MDKKVFKLSKPDKNNVDTYFIAGDWHDLFCHLPSVNILLQHALEIKKDRRKLIINGDFFDLNEIMKSNLSKHKRENIISRIDDHYLPHVYESALWGNDMLDRIQKVFRPENIFITEGNHDVRLEYFRKIYAPKEYKNYFDFKQLLQLTKRKIKSIGYNYWIDIGNLSITHGMYHGVSALNKHYNACGRSVIFSHVHQFNLKSYVRRGETIVSMSLPCMCTLNPEYLRNIENNWSNGYGEINMKSNGKFHFNVHTVTDNELVIQGVTYYG